MIYAQFWHKGTDNLLRPACGSDSVLLIDGRYGSWRQHETAQARLRQSFYARKFDAYTLHVGGSFSRSRCLSALPITPLSGAVDPATVNPEFMAGVTHLKSDI